jgi:hypothetical protein
LGVVSADAHKLRRTGDGRVNMGIRQYGNWMR